MMGGTVGVGTNRECADLTVFFRRFLSSSDFMNSQTPPRETVPGPTPRKKNPIRTFLLPGVFLVLLVPLMLRGLAGYSPVVVVGNTVDALGGRMHTRVAAPEFMQSIVGKDWDGWEQFYGGVEVSQIMLDQCPVADEDLRFLQQTPGLRILGLRATKVTDAGTKNLTYVANLQKLDLSDTGLTDIGLEVLQNLSGLQELVIAGTSISDSGVSRLAGLKNLTLLDVSGTKLTDASIVTLSEMPNLKTLVLNRCNLTDEGLSLLKNSRSLTMLSLEGIPVTGSFLRELQDVPLEQLNLNGSRCDGTALHDSGKLETLKTLSLEHCPVEDVGIPALAAIPRLEDLILDHTKITDAAIAGLRDMRFLRSLSVNSTPVSAEALRELKDTPSLKLVKAYNTKVTRGDIDALGAEIKSFVVINTSTGGG